MDINELLAPAVLRLINDHAAVGDLLDEIRTVKGPRKSTGMNNPCFTAHVPSNSRDETSKVHRGTLRINFHYDNYKSGNANIELMGPVTDSVITLFDDKVFTIDGYRNFALYVREAVGPLFDSEHPDEHYMSIRLKFVLIKL